MCVGEEEDGVEDLDLGLGVDGDGRVVGGDLGKGGVYGGGTDLDGDEGVEGGDGGLEWLEGGRLVGEDAELGGEVGDAEGDAGGDGLFCGAEPGVALCLAEEPVEECVVAVVVHAEEGARGAYKPIWCDLRSRSVWCPGDSRGSQPDWNHNEVDPALVFLPLPGLRWQP